MDPILSRRAGEAILVHAVRCKPFVDQVNTLRFWRHEVLDLFLGKVLTITVVEGVAEQKREARETNALDTSRSTHLT